MAKKKGGDIFLELAADVAELKASSKTTNEHTASLIATTESLRKTMSSMSTDMASLGERMSSLSDTMSVAADTMGTMARSMRHLDGRAGANERLYERLARVVVVHKAQSDER